MNEREAAARSATRDTRKGAATAPSAAVAPAAPVAEPRARESVATGEPLRILSPDGTVDPALDPGLSGELLLTLHRNMLRLRVLDERMLGMQRQGRIGFYGACSGQEAAVVGAGAALLPRDWVFPALREGGIMLLRGYSLKPYLAQIFGNALDPTKGRQMPSHMADRGVNQVSWSSCIGSQLPQAVGAAWASKLRGDNVVIVGFMGDGATSSADFHYAMNFAAIFKLPVVLFCQNNGWSISVPTKEQTAAPTLAHKALEYGLPGHRVDGNDVLAVFSVMHAAVERARRGEGASFIEAVTYRLGAHSSSDDPTRYRDENEVAHWRSLDPLQRLGAYLAARGLLSGAQEEALRGELDAEVRAALAEVEAAPLVAKETLFDDVYEELPWHLAEQKKSALGEE